MATTRFDGIRVSRICRWIDNHMECVGTGTLEEAREEAKRRRPGIEIAWIE